MPTGSARGIDKSRSLFCPSGPLTARHTKQREHLLQSGVPGVKEPVWPKSGPPTTEPRVQKAEVTPALFEVHRPQVKVSRACTDLRRDLVGLLHKKPCPLHGLLDCQAHRKPPARDADDYSDDELWDSIGIDTMTTKLEGKGTRKDLNKVAVARLNRDRVHD